MSVTSITNATLTAKIKHLGAELSSLTTTDGKEFIWQADPLFWGKHSPILFPIVGTLRNNSFQYDGQNYNLSRHGFAREMLFTLIEKTENSATFSLKSKAETLAKYPFPFELQIEYRLLDNQLEIHYTVISKNTDPLPFSIGAHPAFSLPDAFDNYSLVFEQKAPEKYYLLENDLVSPMTQTLKTKENVLELNYELFQKDALIFKKIESKTISLLHHEKPLLKVHFSDFSSLGIWTKENAPFLCIEPWIGYSDTTESTGNLFEKEGIVILEENPIFQAKFSIEIL